MVNDQFGVRMIYPTKNGGETWFLNSSGSNLRGEDPSTGSDSQGTYYTISSDQVRGAATTSAGYSESRIEDDHEKLDLNVGGRGYMMDPKDFKNVEMTGYWFVTSSANDDFVEYCRGGEHSSGKECEGVAIKAAINYLDGRVRIRKEQWHSSGYTDGVWVPAFGSSVRNRWVGFKFVCVNRQRSGSSDPVKFNVYMEIWVDKGANNAWVKVGDQNDTGGWYPGAPNTSCPGGTWCGGNQDQILLWGSPIADIRWDNFNAVDFKWVSVREIVPPYSTL